MESAASSRKLATLCIRPAKAEDALFLVDLRNKLASHFFSGDPATLTKTVELLADERTQTYVLEVDGRTAGSFALYRRRGVSLEFGRFMMEPWASGNGYGRVTLEFAIKEARRLGAKILRLVTMPGNAAAITLYDELGFEVTQVQMELVL